MYTAYKDDDGNVYSESVIEDMFAEMLDECYEPVTIAGMVYDTARALREVDPIAYRVMLSDYMDDYEELTFDTLAEWEDALT